MSGSGFKVCSACGGRYRGAYTVHASTKTHLARVARKGGRKPRRELRAALGYARVNVRRALAGPSEDDVERVRQHRRRRPLDGPARSVKVRRYWRNPPFRGLGSLVREWRG